MARPREIWFERRYTIPVTLQPVHRDGWRAIAVLVAALTGVLVAAIVFSIVGADPGWTLLLMLVCLVVPVWFLLTIRGRIR